MSKRQCEICGEYKEPHEMAKSYKYRCKECVARLTRIRSNLKALVMDISLVSVRTG